MLAYEVRFADAASHHVDVSLRMRAAGPFEAWMPTWTPGSYLIREFARHLRAVSARDATGAPLLVARVDKTTFRVEAGDGDVELRWRVYAFERSVRTSFVDERLALLNGASVFLAIRGREDERCRVAIEPRPGWSVATGLEQVGPFTFEANDHEGLIDGPLLLGALAIQRFEVDGVPHALAIGGGGNFDPEKLAGETSALVKTAAAAFGPLPYESYSFLLYTIGEGQGGLEHRTSCVLAHPRFAFREEKGRHDLLSLLAHEHFHVWNVKRTRPREFARYDLRAETYSRALWICEGVTSYYDELLPLRAGLVGVEAWSKRLGEELTRHFANPGRLAQTLEEASLLAWTRFYRQDEDFANSGVSYYQKGALVALLLDLEIRMGSDGARCLDHVMRELFLRHPDGSGGFTTQEFEEIASQAADRDLAPFFATAVRSTEELEVRKPLAEFGLAIEAKRREPAPDARDWIGARIPASGAARIETVEAGSAAARAGLSARDEVVAADGFRVDASTLAARLEDARGRRIALAVFRDERLIEVALEAPAKPSPVVRVRIDDSGGDAARARRIAWLGSGEPSETPR